MKLDRKQDLNVPYQVCVFWADQKNKMAMEVLIVLRWVTVAPWASCFSLLLYFSQSMIDSQDKWR